MTKPFENAGFAEIEAKIQAANEIAVAADKVAAATAVSRSAGRTGPDLWREVLKDAVWALHEKDRVLSERCKLAIEDMDEVLTDRVLRMLQSGKKPIRKRQQRVIECIRAWSGGNKWAWHFSQEVNAWVHKDGTKVYSVSTLSIGVNGGETYSSEWRITYPDGRDELVPLDLLKRLPPSRRWTE